MLRHLTLAASVALLAVTAAHAALPPASVAAPPANVAAAVADSARPAADTQRDPDRKPAAMLEFAGVKPGQSVADLIPGSGYFTRLFSVAVGPTGKVYAVATPKPADAAGGCPRPFRGGAGDRRRPALRQRHGECRAPEGVLPRPAGGCGVDLAELPRHPQRQGPERGRVRQGRVRGPQARWRVHRAGPRRPRRAPGSAIPARCIASTRKRCARKSSPRASSSQARATSCATRLTRAPRRCSMPPSRATPTSSS